MSIGATSFFQLAKSYICILRHVMQHSYNFLIITRSFKPCIAVVAKTIACSIVIIKILVNLFPSHHDVKHDRL